MIKMNEILKNPKIRMAIALIIAAAIGAYFFKVSYGLWGRYEQIREEIAKSLSDIEKANTIYATQESLNTGIKQLEADIAAAEGRFFSNVEDIFTSLDRFAQASKISLKSVEPTDRKRQDIPHRKDRFLAVLSVSMRMKCDYQQMVGFLKQIESTSKNLEVENINVQGDSANIWVHDVQILVRVPLLVVIKR